MSSWLPDSHVLLKAVTNEMESVIDNLKVLRGMVEEGLQRRLVDNCIQRLQRAVG